MRKKKILHSIHFNIIIKFIYRRGNVCFDYSDFYGKHEDVIHELEKMGFVVSCNDDDKYFDVFIKE